MASGFERLHPTLVHHIVHDLGWKELRPVQHQSIAPIVEGHNVVILAPTAGGKTEACFFPILSQLLTQQWGGLSVLYLSPIRALLNNQMLRLERLFGMIGHRAGVWHGDIAQSVKGRMREDPPTALLTTPESLEAMLMSTKMQAPTFFKDLRVVVIDEVHAFAGDDRGWHLLGVLQRLQALAGQDVQRIGLSATVGNKADIVSWLSSGSTRPQATIDPKRSQAINSEVTLDWVQSLENAALVIKSLHPNQRRLVFCDSRIQSEKLTRLLRGHGVPTFIIHGSLSASERRQTEASFLEGAPGVIVATSALELGIDIGDLDRVINIDAPMTVASFLQRMGRTGRRPTTRPNMLFLCISDWGLVRAASLVDLWARGYVEDVEPPGDPLHIFAQQVMALVLQRPGVAVDVLKQQLRPFMVAAGVDAASAEAILRHLLAQRYLHTDGVRIGMGTEAERELGAKHFLELVSVFTTPPLFTVMHQRKPLGTVHQSTFIRPNEEDASAPMVILLAGRSWGVKSLDWNRKIAYVQPLNVAGTSRWVGSSAPMTRALAQAHRRVLLDQCEGTAHWSKRATASLRALQLAFDFLDDASPTLVSSGKHVEYWNFEGTHTNQLLSARMAERGHHIPSAAGLLLTFRDTELLEALGTQLMEVERCHTIPTVAPDHPTARHLKFNTLLPPDLLSRALAARMFGL